MRQDVLDALSGKFPRKIPCKETLNHPALVTGVSGIDVFQDTPRAFALAWERLGIDIHTPVTTQARPPVVPRGSWVIGDTRYADLGVFPTSMPIECMPGYDKSDPEWVYRYNPAEDDFDLEQKARELRAENGPFRATFGGKAVHYHLYYTTLFMWAVVKFDWDHFMVAATLDPDRFDHHFWRPWTEISRKHVEALCAMDEEVLFVHDDLPMSTGPVFPPAFYETYIFPRYPYILEPVERAGKKLIFVTDGNCDMFLEKLLGFPIDGLMFENPATPFQRVLDTWGKAGRGFIGGIDTTLLTHGTPDAVYRHTRDVIAAGRKYPGFIIASCGGLHGNIPPANLKAYCAARSEAGIQPAVDIDL
jgi:hypothetical protein